MTSRSECLFSSEPSCLVSLYVLASHLLNRNAHLLSPVYQEGALKEQMHGSERNLVAKISAWGEDFIFK